MDLPDERTFSVTDYYQGTVNLWMHSDWQDNPKSFHNLRSLIEYFVLALENNPFLWLMDEEEELVRAIAEDVKLSKFYPERFRPIEEWGNPPQK